MPGTDVRLSDAAFRVWHAVAADHLAHEVPPVPAHVARLTGLPIDEVQACADELHRKGYLLTSARLQLLVWPMQYARVVRRPGVSNETREQVEARA